MRIDEYFQLRKTCVGPFTISKDWVPFGEWLNFLSSLILFVQELCEVFSEFC